MEANSGGQIESRGAAATLVKGGTKARSSGLV